jgi:hypothetical protein
VKHGGAIRGSRGQLTTRSRNVSDVLTPTCSEKVKLLFCMIIVKSCQLAIARPAQLLIGAHCWNAHHQLATVGRAIAHPHHALAHDFDDG